MTDVTQVEAPRMHWPEGPPSFLTQPRAFSALRHELDVVIRELKSAVDECRAALPERPFELLVLPHRVIARLDDVAVSFSWVAGRIPTVRDGRLLVIAWRDVVNRTRGVSALQSATPIHEQTYTPDGATPADWRWRVEDAPNPPCSSESLAAEWIARVNVARAG